MPSRGPTTSPPPANVVDAQSGVDVDPADIVLNEFHDSFMTCYNLNDELTRFDDTTGALFKMTLYGFLGNLVSQSIVILFRRR